MSHTISKCTTKFGQFLACLDRFLSSWTEDRKVGVLMSLLELMKTFVMGTFCLLCGSDQTDLAGHLVQTHYKKTLLNFSRMASLIRFECTFDQVFLSSYRLLGHLFTSHGLLRSCLLDQLDAPKREEI